VKFVREMGGSLSVRNLVVVTSFPSVASAFQLARIGVAGYFAKPVAAATLLQIVRSRSGEQPFGPDDELPGWQSLNRAVWEYLSQVYVSAGSMAEAARRLRIDRRSLRRMLGKYPPNH